MRKTTIGLLVIIGIWCLLQVSAISNSLSLFLVLNINPFTNRALSLPITLMVLAIIAIAAAIFLFSDQSSAFIDVILDWILNTEQDLPRRDKQKSSKPIVLVRTKIKLPKLRYDLDTGWANPITTKPVPIPKFKSSKKRSYIKVFLNSLSSPLIRIAFRLVIAITVGEIVFARFISRIIILGSLISQSIWRTFKAFITNITVLVLTISGYMLLISAIVGFSILRILMPYTRKTTKWLRSKLSANEEVVIMAKAINEISHTFTTWYRELRGIRNAHN